MVKEHITAKHILLIILDIIVINFSYFITLTIRLGYKIPQENLNAYLEIAPLITILSLVVFFIFNLYGNWIYQSWIKILSLVLSAVVLTTVLAMSVIYLTHNFAVPRAVSITNPLIELLLLSSLRIAIWHLYNVKHRETKVLIIADDEQSAFAMVKDFNGQFKTKKYQFSCLQHSGDIRALERVIKQENFDVVAMRSNLADQEKIIQFCIREEKEIFIVPDIFTVLLHSAETMTVNDKVIFKLKPPGIQLLKQLVKRTADIGISIILLIVFSPVMLIITLLIRLTSSGRAFFLQERLGEDGRPFQLLKFRSMISNAEEETGPTLATERDPRITKIGSFLRTYYFDELPQLINVLKGDMSLIGPRPEREYFVQRFRESIPYYSYRMAVKPGITGLAQVMGKYTTSPEDKLRFDLMYIANYSFLLDIRILLLTIRTVILKEKGKELPIKIHDIRRITF